MKGTRPLDNNEIRLVSACFTGNPFEVRNRELFLLGVSTGDASVSCYRFGSEMYGRTRRCMAERASRVGFAL